MFDNSLENRQFGHTSYRERNKKILDMRSEGMTYKAIGNIFGISGVQVSNILYRANKPRRCREEMKKEIEEAYNYHEAKNKLVIDHLCSLTIFDLNTTSVRVLNCLYNAHIYNISDIINPLKNEDINSIYDIIRCCDKLLELPNFGMQSLNNVIYAIQDLYDYLYKNQKQ